MPLTTISGQAGNADFKIGTQSYKTTISQFRVRVDTQQLDTTVFVNEPTQHYDAGATVSRFDVTGINKYGSIEAAKNAPKSDDDGQTQEVLRPEGGRRLPGLEGERPQPA